MIDCVFKAVLVRLFCIGQVDEITCYIVAITAHLIIVLSNKSILIDRRIHCDLLRNAVNNFVGIIVDIDLFTGAKNDFGFIWSYTLLTIRRNKKKISMFTTMPIRRMSAQRKKKIIKI